MVTDGCVEVETSSPAADVDVAELEACVGSAGAASMSSSSSSLASGANWNASVCAPRLWDMACKNCIRVYTVGTRVKPLYTALNAGFILYIPFLFRPPYANPVADALFIGRTLYRIKSSNKVVCISYRYVLFTDMHFLLCCCVCITHLYC